MSFSLFRKLLLTGFVVVLAIAAGAIFMKPGSQHAGASAPEGGMMGGPMGAMPVPAAVVARKEVRLWTSYPGRMKAVDSVELRPQVDGRIEEIKFEDGQIVAKGDVLFVIEPGPYEAAFAEAEAALSAAKSQYGLASRELKRAEELIKTEAISEKTLDERRNAARLAKNLLDGAEALVKRAQIDLDRANLKAPIGGRISRAEVTVGNLVQTGPGAPVLSTIVSDEGIYADFEVDEQTYLRSIREKSSGLGPAEPIPVEIVLGDGSRYQGHIRSFDNKIDISSGTIRARAYFDNKDGKLLPGMYVTARLGSPVTEQAILLPERAIGTDQDRKFVYVIDENGMSAYRPVKLGAAVDGSRVIASGLEPGETVIIEGIVKIMPGMPVTPQTGEETKSEPAPLLPPETE